MPVPMPSQPGTEAGQQGSGDASGSWFWSGTHWVWNQNPDWLKTPGATGKNPHQGYFNSGGVKVTATGVGTPTTTQIGYSIPPRATSPSSFGPRPDVKPEGENPFGNDVPPANLSYTPFALGGGGQQGAGGVSAFASPYARQSDKLVPSLDAIRMQRLMSQYGGGR